MRIYIDTSVIGGIFDSEFSEVTALFFSQAKDNKYEIIISTVVEKELELAPENVKNYFEKEKKNLKIVNITDKDISLQRSYLEQKIVTEKYALDALHVAIASTNECQIIVSWNFKHIVNFQKIPLYNAINMIKGYNSIQIFSPMEVINYEE